MFDPKHAKNADVVRYLGSVESRSPDEVSSPYMTLGTHPELVERLWDELGAALPVRCAWVVGKRPVLMRPDTGVVFGIAVGTAFYALRLPRAARRAFEEAKRRAVEQSADKFSLWGEDRSTYLAGQLRACPVGHEWCSGRWLAEELEMSKQAYDWAG